MDTTQIQAVHEWMKTTDLVEVSYKKDARGLALRAADAPAEIAGGLPPSRFVPVASEAVGIFQWSEPGRPRRTEEGSQVAAGDALAVIVSGTGAAKPVKAPCAGRVAKCFADSGEAVEYGRPLFLIEPR